MDGERGGGVGGAGLEAVKLNLENCRTFFIALGEEKPGVKVLDDRCVPKGSRMLRGRGIGGRAYSEGSGYVSKFNNPKEKPS